MTHLNKRLCASANILIGDHFLWPLPGHNPTSIKILRNRNSWKLRWQESSCGRSNRHTITGRKIWHQYLDYRNLSRPWSILIESQDHSNQVQREIAVPPRRTVGSNFEGQKDFLLCIWSNKGLFCVIYSIIKSRLDCTAKCSWSHCLKFMPDVARGVNHLSLELPPNECWSYAPYTCPRLK